MRKLAIMFFVMVLAACSGLHKQIKQSVVQESKQYTPERRWYFGKVYMWKHLDPHPYHGIALSGTDDKEKWDFSVEIMRTQMYVIQTQAEKNVSVPLLEPLDTGVSTSSQTSRISWYGDIAMRYRVWEQIITPKVKEPFKLKMGDRLGLGLGTNTLFEASKYTVYLKEEDNNGKPTGKTIKKSVTNPLAYTESEPVIFLSNVFELNIGLLKGQLDIQIPIEATQIKDDIKTVVTVGVEF